MSKRSQRNILILVPWLVILVHEHTLYCRMSRRTAAAESCTGAATRVSGDAWQGCKCVSSYRFVTHLKRCVTKRRTLKWCYRPISDRDTARLLVESGLALTVKHTHTGNYYENVRMSPPPHHKDCVIVSHTPALSRTHY